MKGLEVLFEDDFCIIVDKPAGLAVQGGKGVKSSLDRILAEIRTPAPLLVHRLDKDTSGVLLAAKNKEAAARFSRIFGAERKAVKQYIAVCAGQPEKDEGVITEDLMIKNSLKKSETRYKVIRRGKLEDAGLEYAMLEIELGTGRMHQIRRHLAMKGNPVLGDDKYGDFKLNKRLRKDIGLKRLLLHASRLVIDECGIDVAAALPEIFGRF
jgi:23S rRNA pseudouridine955/2504/2580 synthase